MSSHTFDLPTHGLFPPRHEGPRAPTEKPRSGRPRPEDLEADREELLWHQQRRRRRIVRAVAIFLLIAATVALLFIASDAGARGAILDWTTMRRGSFARDMPYWGA